MILLVREFEAIHARATSILSEAHERTGDDGILEALCVIEKARGLLLREAISWTEAELIHQMGSVQLHEV
jgi:hypothetical protein